MCIRKYLRIMYKRLLLVGSTLTEPEYFNIQPSHPTGQGLFFNKQIFKGSFPFLKNRNGIFQYNHDLIKTFLCLVLANID